jgi:hypothetical protein
VYDNYEQYYRVIAHSASILQLRLCITYDYNKYHCNSATSNCPYIHTTFPHIDDPDSTTRIMDSGRLEDHLQQYITHLQNLQGEQHIGREQQEQNFTNQHGSGTTNSAIPADIQTSRAASAVLGRKTSCVVRSSRGAI